jgi:hypothetical protein
VRHPILGIRGAKPRLSTLLKAEALPALRKKRKRKRRKNAKAA